MPKNNFVFPVLIFSFVLHILFISLCSLRIKAKANPSVSGWLNIVGEKDLFLKEKEVVFPRGVSFSSNSLRKEYFSLPFSAVPRFLNSGGQESSELPFHSAARIQKTPIFFKKKNGYFYLWKKISIFSSREEETVPYRAYVSARGKVLFTYPEKLPVNSSGSLHSQEYIREAVLFLNDEFLWTRFEEVVQ